MPPFALALAEIVFVILAGLAVCSLLAWKPERPATVLLIGLLVVSAEVPFLALLSQPAGVGAAWLSMIVFAGLVVYRRRLLGALPFSRGDLLWPAAASASTILLAGFLLASEYRAGRLLDADSLVMWALRGHFVFAGGIFSSDFWGIIHPDYPPLLPLLNAHGYFLAGVSGEVPTVVVAYVLAFVAVFALGDALARVVSRPWIFAVPLLFVLTPVPTYPVHPRILLAGYADAWSILFVALLCLWNPRSRGRPMSGDEGVVLLTISLLKNEGCVLACFYAVVRCLLIAIGDARPVAAALRAAPRFALALAPGLGWIALVRAARVGSHYDFFRLPSASETVERLGAMLEFYRGLPWIYWLVPLVLVCSLVRPASTEAPVLGRPDPWRLWMVFHAAALYGLVGAVVVMFNGLPRLALENSFHRLHWSVLLISLILAARMADLVIARASPEPRTPEREASPA